MKLIAGTRGSALAISQTDSVINLIKSVVPNIEIEKKIITTKGDKILDRPLDKIGDKGLFVAEIEGLLLSGEIDFAVHSLKDMPTEENNKLKLAKTLKRADRRDVLILNPKYDISKKEDIMKFLRNAENLKIGTGSKRRISQLLRINEKLDIKNIRGNIDTRLKKMVSEELDAIVLAKAGIDRLGISPNSIMTFDETDIIPACGQGALAVEIRRGDSFLEELFKDIGDDISDITAMAEREFLKNVGGGCHAPVGAFAEVVENNIKIVGMYGDEDMKNIRFGEIEMDLNLYIEAGRLLAKKLINK